MTEIIDIAYIERDILVGETLLYGNEILLEAETYPAIKAVDTMLYNGILIGMEDDKKEEKNKEDKSIKGNAGLFAKIINTIKNVINFIKTKLVEFSKKLVDFLKSVADYVVKLFKGDAVTSKKLSKLKGNDSEKSESTTEENKE